MKVLLVQPPKTNQIWVGVPDIFNMGDSYLFPPLGIMYLKGYLDKHSNHEVKLLDCVYENSTLDDIKLLAETFKPDFVGITTHTHNLIDVVKIVRTVKGVNGNTHVSLGGGHPRVYPTYSIKLPLVDSVVPGDGEETLHELLLSLEKKGSPEGVPGVIWKNQKGEIIDNGPRTAIADLDTLPFPYRNVEEMDRYFTPAMKDRPATTLISSRGCPNRCVFCSTYKDYRARSPKNVVDELEHCVNMGYKEFLFVDDIFNITPQRVIDIADQIIKRNLKIRWGFKGRCDQITPEMLDKAKESGITKIHYGVETGTDEGLQRLNKRVTTKRIEQVFRWTKERGIKAIAYMMIGLPNETSKEDVYKTFDFINKIDPDFVAYALYSPYPDSQSYKEGIKIGLFKEDVWLKHFQDPEAYTDLPSIWEEHLSREELVSLFKTAHRRFYFRPGKIIKSLARAGSLHELGKLIQGGLVLLKLETFRKALKRI